MHDHLLPLLLLAVCSVLTLGCQPSGTRDTDLAAKLQGLVDAVASSDDAIPGVALHVEAPALGLSFSGAAGTADPDSGAAMTAGHPVRIASNTKTYVAAAVLRLAEQGRLHVDDPIARHLCAEHLEMLRGDGYDTEAITLRHLLTHTSGLYDHSSSDNYLARILGDPGHRWTRTEQLQAAIDWGDPHGPPASEYRYCDTGYVLLGEVVENASGLPMAAALRDLLGFANLGLRSTWLETLEPTPDGVGEIAHQFHDTADARRIDASIDLYGGGGLVATVSDMARFYRALFRGQVLAEPSSLQTMLSTVAVDAEFDPAAGPEGYRMGIQVVDLDGVTVHRHTGHWGTVATYVPSLDIVLAGTVNQHLGKEGLLTLEREALRVVREAMPTG
jgi:D-alanyl-D-alanine carboxypeptidase